MDTYQVIRIKSMYMYIQKNIMSGSGASNLGYGDIMPNSNVNSSYVNVTGGNYAGGFGSNETQAGFGLSGLSNNVCAANASCSSNVSASGPSMWGGRKKSSKCRLGIRRMSKRMTRSIMNRTRGVGKSLKRSVKWVGKRAKKSLRSIGIKLGGRRRRHHSTHRHKRHHKMRGGTYQQYGSNIPNTPNYSLGGNLSPDLSALANPPTYHAFNDCKDNYNHYNDPATNSQM